MYISCGVTYLYTFTHAGAMTELTLGPLTDVLNPIQDPHGSTMQMFDPRRLFGRVLALPKEFEWTQQHTETLDRMTTLDAFEWDTLAHVCIAVVAITLFRFALRPIVSIVARMAGVNTSDEVMMSRFETSSWETVYYWCSITLGMYVYVNEDWTVWPTTNIWMGWPLQPLSDAFRCYYLLGLAFYSQALFALFFIDKRRKDFLQYLIHHVVTILLITLSYQAKAYRYGLLILMLHDAGDALLGLAKSIKYANGNPDAVFAIFSVQFFFLRVVFLPFSLIPSGSWEVAQTSATSNKAIPGWWIMNALLLSLQALHFFWFKLLVDVLWNKLVLGKDLEDVREDDDKKKK